MLATMAATKYNYIPRGYVVCTICDGCIKADSPSADDEYHVCAKCRHLVCSKDTCRVMHGFNCNGLRYWTEIDA